MGNWPRRPPCQRCGHMKVDHPANRRTPCIHSDYGWTCDCPGYIEDAPPVAPPGEGSQK